MAYEDRNLTWWQKLLVKTKLWQPPHRTLHHAIREMEPPPPPPVSGAHGNKLVVDPKPRRVPQSSANVDNRPPG